MKFKIKASILAVLFLLTVVGCNQQYKEYVENGKQAMVEDNYPEAILFFNYALAEEPNDQEVKDLLEEARQKMLQIGKQAMVEEKYPEAIHFFNYVLAEEPNDQEVKDLLEEASLKQDLKEYVNKTMTIHNKFLDVFAISGRTQNDADEMNNLLIEADFTPPKDIYEIHQEYIQFLEHQVNSANLFVSGDITQSIAEMKIASDYFSEYKHKFNYFLDDNGIQKNEIGWGF